MSKLGKFFLQANNHGVILSFLGAFDGSIDLLHLVKHGGSGDIEKTYPSKTKVVRRDECGHKNICKYTVGMKWQL